jgi:hypothetical protein
MIRRLYHLLVRLHPQGFRDRFGNEMLLIYDDVSDSRGRASLFADAILSAFRQHVLRGGACIAASTLRHNPHGGPLFAGIENSRPSLLILTNGCAATALAWLGLSFMMAPARDHRIARLDFGGAHRLVDSRLYPPNVQIHASGPSAQQAPRAEYRRPQPRSVSHGRAAPSIWSRTLFAFGVTSGAELDAVAMKMRNDGIHTSPAPQNASRARQPHPVLTSPRVGAALYASDPLLSAIDRDLDSRLSASEIAVAPERLLSLDNNRDGRLTPEECGVRAGSGLEGRSTIGMSVFSALDRDRNGYLSAVEISNAARVLSGLDRDRDGWISRVEIE